MIAMIALSPIAPSGLVSNLSAAMVKAELGALDLTEQWKLDALLGTAIGAVNSKLSEIGDENSGLVKARDDAFEDYRKAYKQYYSPSAEPDDSPSYTVPSVTQYSFACAGNSSCSNTFGTPSEAISGDFVTCGVKPHSDTGFGWYSCLRSSCPKPDPHYRLCPGVCGEYFPPGKQNRGQGNYYYFNNSPHKVTCSETVYNVLNPWDTCDEVYYTCQNPTCPESSTHWSASVSPSNGSYYASAGDSHTADFSASSAYSSVYWYVKSPSESGLGSNVEIDTGSSTSTTASMTYTFASDASGDYVITAYVYPYDSSESVYEVSYTVNVSSSSSDPPPSDSPSDPPDDGDENEDEDEDDEDDEDSSSVTCGAAGWTGCDSSGITHPNDHKVDSCSNCGNHYWTCGSGASWHTESITCQRPDCGATFTGCTNYAGACSSPNFLWHKQP